MGQAFVMKISGQCSLKLLFKIQKENVSYNIFNFLIKKKSHLWSISKVRFLCKMMTGAFQFLLFITTLNNNIKPIYSCSDFGEVFEEII